MKILIATGLYPPESGGPATYAKMAEDQLQARGFEIQVLPFREVRKYPRVIRHFVYFFKVWKLSKSVDIVYALDPVSVGLPASWAARLRRKKFMLRLGGDYAWEQGRVRFGVTDTLDEYTEHRSDAPWQVRVLAWLQTSVAKKASVVVAPSKYLKGIVLTWGISQEKVQVIYSSLVPVAPTQGKDSVLQSMELTGPVVITAARLVPWKGVRVLIEVVADLRERFPKITLLIIGDGPEEAALQAQIKKYNLQQHVRLLGRLKRAESASIIAASDVFVLNTAYEGLSHQLLEVMDWGTPIVTTTAGGNTELLSDGVDALLVEFNDRTKLETAIATVLTNPDTATHLTQFARARSKEFSEEKVVDDLERLLQNVYEA